MAGRVADKQPGKYNARFAGEFQKGTIDFDNILVPAIDELLPEVDAKVVIDLGCGEGRFSRHFASRGARVIGVDSNREQIARAAALSASTPRPIKYVVADAVKLAREAGPVELEAYDLALLMFVILDQHSEREVKDLVLASAAYLRRGGALLIADLHPHNLDRENLVEHAALPLNTDYFENGFKFASETLLEDQSPIRFYPNFHYRLDFIIEQICGAGLVIDRLMEPRYLSPFPTHIVIRALKP